MSTFIAPPNSTIPETSSRGGRERPIPGAVLHHLEPAFGERGGRDAERLAPVVPDQQHRPHGTAVYGGAVGFRVTATVRLARSSPAPQTVRVQVVASDEGGSMSMSDQASRDAADLEKFGYKQELKRALHTFSSFAVAFSYISPSTGIFTLFFLGMAAVGAFLFWTWPLVALMQFVVALNFAELSSHFPVAGSVYQWTKYLAGRGYAWFTGWFYLIAGHPDGRVGVRDAAAGAASRC